MRTPLGHKKGCTNTFDLVHWRNRLARGLGGRDNIVFRSKFGHLNVVVFCVEERKADYICSNGLVDSKTSVDKNQENAKPPSGTGSVGVRRV